MSDSMQTQSTVTPSAASALGEETLFLDVREIGEYEQGHIGGAIALPLSQISSPAVRRMLREGERCVVVCKGGMRARKAAQMLGAAGIGNLHILEGGMDAWVAAGLPVDQGSGALSIQSQTRMGAGLIVLTGALLGFFVDKTWILLSAFAGCGLILAGLTGWCGMSLLLAKMPWNRSKACTCSR